MLRQSVWIAIIIASLSVLTACPHNKIVGHEAALEPKNSIVGTWESLEPRSGLVNVLEFDPDGKSKSSLIARVYMNYHIEGDKVILIPDNDNSGEKNQPAKSDADEKSVDKGKKPADKETGTDQTEAKQDDQSKSKKPGSEPVVYTYVLEKDKMKMTHDASGQVMDMWRDDNQTTEPDSIVGLWSYKHPTGEIAHMLFDANGTDLIRAPMPGGVEGTYEIKGDTVTVTSLDKKHTQTATFKLEDGKLVLNDGKKTSSYVRMSEPK